MKKKICIILLVMVSLFAYSQELNNEKLLTENINNENSTSETIAKNYDN